jgi:hypothetical protein
MGHRTGDWLSDGNGKVLMASPTFDELGIGLNPSCLRFHHGATPALCEAHAQWRGRRVRGSAG